MQKHLFAIEKCMDGSYKVGFDPNEDIYEMATFFHCVVPAQFHKILRIVPSHCGDFIFIPKDLIHLWKDRISPYIFLETNGRPFFMVSDDYELMRNHRK